MSRPHTPTTLNPVAENHLSGGFCKVDSKTIYRAILALHHIYQTWNTRPTSLSMAMDIWTSTKEQPHALKSQWPNDLPGGFATVNSKTIYRAIPALQHLYHTTTPFSNMEYAPYFASDDFCGAKSIAPTYEQDSVPEMPSTGRFLQ